VPRGGGSGEEEARPDNAGGEENEALEEAYWVMQQAVSMLVKQVPEQARAADLMTHTEKVAACRPTDTMEEALALMNERRKRAVPVLTDDDTLLGFIKYRDPIKAVGAGKGQQQVKAWMRRELLTCEPDTPFADMEALLLAGDTGRLHVVDDEHKLIGLVSRTDILRHYALYRGI